MVLSPSARKVWIEMPIYTAIIRPLFRHLPQGRCGLKWSQIQTWRSSKRHLPQGRCGLKSMISIAWYRPSLVTFRKEGVDWNRQIEDDRAVMLRVTFRKEGVDWNLLQDILPKSYKRHLPQGRCGLKLLSVPEWSDYLLVTFRKEGVDWNFESSHKSILCPWSPSARKVWIEIYAFLHPPVWA